MAKKQQVKYFVFDIESVADGDLISDVRYPKSDPSCRLSADDAIAEYRKELMEQKGSDFIPHTFHVPVSVVVAKLAEDFSIVDLVALDEPNYRPHVIAENFWRGWKAYGCPTLVSFNGRSFDLPVMELAAFRYGISVPDWFNMKARTYEQKRNRYNLDSHLDLHDVMTNFSACRFNGGLNLAANILGTPGKMDTAGFMVQDLFLENKLQQINDYCRCDVLDTYFVLLRCATMMGWMGLERERELVEQTKGWLEERSTEFPAFAEYLGSWSDWKNPWQDSQAESDPSQSAEQPQDEDAADRAEDEPSESGEGEGTPVAKN